MQQYDRAYFGNTTVWLQNTTYGFQNTTVRFQNTTVLFAEYDCAVSGIRLGMSQEKRIVARCHDSRDVARMSWNVVRMSRKCRGMSTDVTLLCQHSVTLTT